MLKVLAQEHSLVLDFLAELRNVNFHTDRARFRRNVERIGEIMAYEMSKTLPRHGVEVKTPLGTHLAELLAEQPIIATVLRAGLPLQQGFLNYFDKADCAFVSAYRKSTTANQFQVLVEYLACPDISGRTLILVDPMLATGQSLFLAYEALLTKGLPSKVIIASLIASQEGLEFIQEHLPKAEIYLGDLDPSLDEMKYIVPGLGDAGDISFGSKLQH